MLSGELCIFWLSYFVKAGVMVCLFGGLTITLFFPSAQAQANQGQHVDRSQFLNEDARSGFYNFYEENIIFRDLGCLNVLRKVVSKDRVYFQKDRSKSTIFVKESNGTFHQ